MQAPILSRRLLFQYTIVCALIILGYLGAFGTFTRKASYTHWRASNFKSLIAFGDSYTDECRLQYTEPYFSNNEAHPPGVLLGESSKTMVGGRTWARYVIQYTGSTLEDKWMPSMTLYNYAVAGAICTNEITDWDLPTLYEYSVPQFRIDARSNRLGTNEPYFQPALSPTNAVFAVWMGTNDFGAFGFLTDRQKSGKTVRDYTDCIYKSLDGMYAGGARTFVLMNTIPLELLPLYANTTLHGETDMDERAAKALMLTTSANTILKYQTPFEMLIQQRYPGAKFAYFDVSSLLHHMYVHPEQYLNGTMPLNVTGSAEHSPWGREDPDSFLWNNGLHISEQTGRVIARHFIEVLNGVSKYATYL